ncbi:MAG: geranylgeranylglyceryl/heptaprenylglyceryl phosphate synthase [Promethearchaeati archaeon SRVP18_Atabeyarchaeia-1]
MPGERIWKYITDALSKDHVLHLSLIDPDPLTVTAEQAGKMAELAAEAGTDGIMVGGSTAFGILDETVKEIKSRVDVPVILFPGNVNGLTKYADAVFFMNLLNSRNTYWMMEAAMLSAPAVRMLGLETISMAYLVVEPGGTAGWVGEARLIPRDKPKIAAAYALEAEMVGYKLVYLEAGSGASASVPPEMVKLVSGIIELPLVVGGGIVTTEQAVALAKAGAKIIVQGNIIEKTVIKDKGNLLKETITRIKEEGKKKGH